MSQTEQEVFKLINVIEELTLMLSERLWNDDSIPGRFVLASLADGASAAALGLRIDIESGGLRSEKSERETGNEVGSGQHG